MSWERSHPHRSRTTSPGQERTVGKRLRWLAGLGALALTVGLGLAATAQPAAAATGFTVSGSRILDANGNPFVMRGVNHAHTWYLDRFSSFADIKALGANTVRVVLSSGGRWTRNDAADAPPPAVTNGAAVGPLPEASAPAE